MSTRRPHLRRGAAIATFSTLALIAGSSAPAVASPLPEWLTNPAGVSQLPSDSDQSATDTDAESVDNSESSSDSSEAAQSGQRGSSGSSSSSASSSQTSEDADDSVPDESDPALSVTYVGDLDPTGDTINITGQGFDADGSGIFVGLTTVEKLEKFQSTYEDLANDASSASAPTKEQRKEVAAAAAKLFGSDALAVSANPANDVSDFETAKLGADGSFSAPLEVNIAKHTPEITDDMEFVVAAISADQLRDRSEDVDVAVSVAAPMEMSAGDEGASNDASSNGSGSSTSNGSNSSAQNLSDSRSAAHEDKLFQQWLSGGTQRTNGNLIPSSPGLPSVTPEQIRNFFEDLFGNIPWPDSPGLPGGGGSSDNQGSNKLELSKDKDLSPSGEKVSIKGTGYQPGQAIYISQTIDKPDNTYPRVYGEAVKVTADDSGAFTTELDVAPNFQKGSTTVDCTKQACYVASFSAFPRLNDRSADYWAPISFAGNDGTTTSGDNVAGGADSGSGSGSGSAGGSGNAGGNGTGSNNSGSNAGGNAGGNAGSGNAGGGASGGSTGGNGSGTSSSGARSSANPTTGLNPNGDTVTVSGSGFKTGGNGIYVGLAEQRSANFMDFESFHPDAVWVSERRQNLNSDGSFTVQLPVSAQFNSYNCLENACSIYTFAAHGSEDRSQDTSIPVSFAGGVEATDTGQGPATGGGSGSSAGGAAGSGSGSSASGSGSRPGGSSGSGSRPSSGSSSSSGGSSSSGSSSSNPSVSLSTTTIAPEGITPVTVTGSGFKTSGPGVYVGVVERDKFSHTDASVFGAVNFVRSSEMTSSGGWSTTLDVDAVFDQGNCLVNQCAIVTFAAHGSSDRSQDTFTNISIAGGAEAAKAAQERAEKSGRAGANGKNKAQSNRQGGPTGSASASTGGNGEEEVAENGFFGQAASEGFAPIAWAGLGALLTALVAAALWFFRLRPESNDEDNQV